MSNIVLDAVIIGAGPAGAVTARQLALAGRSVMLMDRQQAWPFRPGEGLPPAAGPLLRALGLWDTFRADDHRPSVGNASAWGSAQLHYTDFLRDPNGGGWHLQRQRFDETLRVAAKTVGVLPLFGATILNIKRDGTRWRLLVRSADGALLTIHAAFVVDATGRASWLTRKLNVERHDLCAQVAFYALYESDSADADRLTLLETVEDGWWYTVALSDRQRVVVLHSDQDLPSARAARAADGWQTLVEKTQHVQARLGKHHYRLTSAPRGTAANGARLERLAGQGWLAVGDAAMSFDPLSSQGIFSALYGAKLAAKAIDQVLSGSERALANYEQRMATVFAHYLRQYQTYYRSERRWPTAPYWTRRWG